MKDGLHGQHFPENNIVIISVKKCVASPVGVSMKINRRLYFESNPLKMRAYCVCDIKVHYQRFFLIFEIFSLIFVLILNLNSYLVSRFFFNLSKFLFRYFLLHSRHFWFTTSTQTEISTKSFFRKSIINYYWLLSSRLYEKNKKQKSKLFHQCYQ